MLHQPCLLPATLLICGAPFLSQKKKLLPAALAAASAPTSAAARSCGMSMPPTASLSALTTDESSQPVLGSVSVGGEVEEEEEDVYYDQPPPGPSLGERHQAHDSRRPLTAEQKAEAARCLRSSTLFKFCSDESIANVIEHMTREPFSEGEVGFCGVAVSYPTHLSSPMNQGRRRSCEDSEIDLKNLLPPHRSIQYLKAAAAPLALDGNFLSLCLEHETLSRCSYAMERLVRRIPVGFDIL